jgi:hypothetical protein
MASVKYLCIYNDGAQMQALDKNMQIHQVPDSTYLIRIIIFEPKGSYSSLDRRALQILYDEMNEFTENLMVTCV